MEKDIKKNRLRAPNFTISEGLHLCEVIEKYKHLIENKKTDAASLQEKQKAWASVVDDYNSTTTTYARTLESLQQCYKNMKKRARKRYCSSKTNNTAGGTQTKQNEDDALLDKVCSLVGAPLDEIYNSDGESAVMACQVTYTDRDSDSEDVDDTSTEEQCTPAKKSRRNTDWEFEKMNTLTGQKMDLVMLQKQMVMKKLDVEEEKLAQIHRENEILKLKMIEEQEKLAHNRALRIIELEEAKEKAKHNEMRRKVEMDNLLKE